MLDDPITRDPVHMHIENAHKDRHLQATLTEQLHFICLLDDNYATICRANNL